ncbi:MAG: glycoside hydrolase family 172 protein [bacterium]
MRSPLDTIAKFREGKTKRISSYNRTGGNADRIQIGPGETVTIAEMKGAGCIRHIWITIGHPDPMHRRNMILRAYWDGHDEPSIECPIGDFFGQGWGENYCYASMPLAAAPMDGKALNCYFPMPFAEGARITIENDSDEQCRAFYYYVDYESYDKLGEDIGRFHACWNRTLEAPPEKMENEWSTFAPQTDNLTDKFNHPIIDAEGRGHYVGVNYFVDCPTPMWYGEGDDMFFIDGEAWPPSLHGTGTEDYFNSSWSPKEIYLHPYFGYPRVNKETGWLGRTHCYRFHIEDPVIFESSLRGSIERGHANCLAIDLVTVAYWYQTLPHKPFNPLPNREGRKNLRAIGPRDIHIWREAWRQMMGGGALWGYEAMPEKFLKKLDKQAASGRKKLAPKEAQKAAAEERKKQDKMLRGKKAKSRKKK